MINPRIPLYQRSNVDRSTTRLSIVKILCKPSPRLSRKLNAFVPEVAAEVVKCCFLLICRVNKSRGAPPRIFAIGYNLSRILWREEGDEWSGNEWKNERWIRRWRDWYDALRWWAGALSLESVLIALLRITGLLAFYAWLLSRIALWRDFVIQGFSWITRTGSDR